jgi:hypothetical protein
MLKKVVEQLQDEQYQALHLDLSENRGEKFLKLLELCREPGLSDAQLREGVGVNQAAFYTLKSRLYDKVQQFLFRTASDDRADLLKNISSIPFLVNRSPRETAISLLDHLETALRRLDMPSELISVYNALKKLHINSPRYYDYQQLYNRNVAYALALDKADELCALFTRELGEWMLSHNAEKKEILRLYLKEITSYSRLYDSHRLTVTRTLMSLSFALFVSGNNEVPESDETAEELLKQLQTIFCTHESDRQYRLLDIAWNYLNFEYYHRLGLHKNAAASLEKCNTEAENLLRLNHTIPAAWFLISRAERAAQVAPVSPDPVFRTSPDPEDTFSFFCFHLGKAADYFQKQEYNAASAELNQVINGMSFKNATFAECQVKLFLGLNQLLAGKTESAEVVIRSITRKLAGEEFALRFAPAHAFVRFIKIALNDSTAQKRTKTEQAWNAFRQANNGEDALLKFIVLNEKQLDQLAR